MYDYTSHVPHNVAAVFFYLFVTTRTEGLFQRGYYEISTHQAETTFMQYMNVAFGQGLLAINSANLWFPNGDDNKLNVTLVHAGSDEKRSIAGKRSEDDDEWGDLFLIGYSQ